MNGSLFLEKLVFVWVYFQILRRHLPTKTKIDSPPRGFTYNTEKNIYSVPLKRRPTPGRSTCTHASDEQNDITNIIDLVVHKVPF